MRQIGTLSGEREAQTLVDYLLTQGIAAQSDEGGDAWAIWIREENQLDSAKAILEKFEKNPTSPEYSAATPSADKLREDALQKRMSAVRRTVDMRAKWSQPLRRRAPLVMVMIGLSIFVSLATRLGRDDQSNLLHALMFSDTRAMHDAAGRGQPYETLSPIKHGQVWRMVTPVFLHAGWLHLLFNMWWLNVLAVQLEARRGTVRFGAFVLVLALASNWAQFLIGQSPNFMGMSGVVYGVFGYLWVTLRVDPRAGYMLGEGTVFIMMAVLVAGFAGIIGGIANWAHAGGLVAGMAIAYGEARSAGSAGRTG